MRALAALFLLSLLLLAAGCADSASPADASAADAGVDRGLPDAPRADVLAGDGPKVFDPCTTPADCPIDTSCGPYPLAAFTPCRFTSTRYCRPGNCNKVGGINFTPACQSGSAFCVPRCVENGPSDQCPQGLTCAKIGQTANFGCQPI